MGLIKHGTGQLLPDQDPAEPVEQDGGQSDGDERAPADQDQDPAPPAG